MRAIKIKDIGENLFALVLLLAILTMILGGIWYDCRKLQHTLSDGSTVGDSQLEGGK